MVGVPGKAIKFVENNIRRHNSDECLIWPFASQHGYGVVQYEGKMTKVHRVACRIFNGPPPTPEHEVAHNCNVSLCCNGRHTRWATHAENEDDKKKFGTRPRGEKHGRTLLSEYQVREMFALKGTDTQRNIAKRFGVSFNIVNGIFTGRNWSHITGLVQ